MAQRPDPLLVVAPRPPHHDQNSGDLRLFWLLKLLASHYRIHYLAIESGCPPRYLEDLRSIGVTVLPTDTSFVRLLRTHRFSVALFEFYHVAETYLPRVRLLQPRCRVVVDTVDVHFLREHMRGRVTADELVMERATTIKTRELTLYAQADMLFTATDDDAQALVPTCDSRRIRVIPNIHEITPPPTPTTQPRLIFVGGFNHVPNVDAVIYFCRDILPVVRKRVPTVHLTIVGSNPPPEVSALSGEHVLVTGFVPSTTPFLHSSRVSVAPLRFGAGMKGKVGEAMAHGVPVVTTTVGAQGMRLQHRVDSLIADDPMSFAAAVVDLLTDNQLHDRIMHNAMDHLSRHFTPFHVASALSRTLADLATLPINRMPASSKLLFLASWTRAACRTFLGMAKS